MKPNSSLRAVVLAFSTLALFSGLTGCVTTGGGGCGPKTASCCAPAEKKASACDSMEGKKCCSMKKP